VLAIGASLATAAVGLLPGCEEDDPDNTPPSTVQPVYGAPAQLDGGNGADAGDAGRAPTSDAGQAVAIYGAPVVPAQDAGAPDGSVSDAAVYGAPVVPPRDAGAPDGSVSVIAVYGAPIVPPRDAGVTDGGAGDAGHPDDAGADAGPDAGADAGRTDGGRAVPVYGAPVSS
jgi:hypothetical protein